MFLLVRDEDVPTVIAAITAAAVEANLEPVDLAEEAGDPIAMLAVLTGPRVFVSMNEEHVFVSGLESLDIAEADEWGTSISAACETEVVAIDVAEDGVRAWVFDGGELDETIEVPLDPKGRTVAPQLVELTTSEAGRRELERGIVGSRPEELAQSILRCLGAEQNVGAQMLAFRDPLEEGGGLDAEPALVVDALTDAGLEGRVGSAVVSPNGNPFGVTLAGAEKVEGLRFEITGDGLELLTLDEIDVFVRLRGAHELVHRAIKPVPAPSNGTIVIEIADAFLERAEIGPPQLDATDLFASMQRIMSAGDQALLNTLTIRPSGTGRRAGKGTLVLKASPLAGGTVAAGEASIPVRVA
jgi:hypothetical protein